MVWSVFLASSDWQTFGPPAFNGPLKSGPQAGQPNDPPPSLSSPLRSSTRSSPTYREVLSPTRPAPVSPVDPEPGDYSWVWHTLSPYMANIADWHTQLARICKKWGAPLGIAASEFSAQNLWHTAVITLFPEPFNWTGWMK